MRSAGTQNPSVELERSVGTRATAGTGGVTLGVKDVVAGPGKNRSGILERKPSGDR